MLGTLGVAGRAGSAGSTGSTETSSGREPPLGEVWWGLLLGEVWWEPPLGEVWRGLWLLNFHVVTAAGLPVERHANANLRLVCRNAAVWVELGLDDFHVAGTQRLADG